MKRRVRADPVTPDVAAFVYVRDGRACVAPRIDPDCGPCSPHLRLEHVKREPRMGLRAESVPGCLAVLCDNHTEPGMKAGFIWCTANREGLRRYLAQVTQGEERAA